MSRTALERTEKLFEKLWAPYDDRLFEESVVLFSRRLELAGIDRGWFRGKTVLDAGCGGGRNTIAMLRLEVAEAFGIDLGAEGIINARKRAEGHDNINFQQASILDIPFPDDTFDVVWCAGVVMITDDEERALDELARVCKPGGMLYLLVYASGGMRWPLIQALRPIAAWLGQAEIERAMQMSGMPANKRRTFLDDLYCPRLDFYSWDRLQRLLERRGFVNLNRWGPETRLDHEQSLAHYREDLEYLEAMFAAGASLEAEFGREISLFRQSRTLTQTVINCISWFEEEVSAGRTTEAEAMATVIGQGHHRVLATKEY